MKKVFFNAFVVSASGYFLSIFLYGFTFIDFNSLTTFIHVPLAISLLGTFTFAIAKRRQDKGVKDFEKKESGDLDTLRAMFKGVPPLVIVLAGISFAFGVISSSILFELQPGIVDIIDGEYVIHNRGDILKRLNEQEYKHELAIQARTFLGIYIAFLGIGTAFLYPNKKEENNL